MCASLSLYSTLTRRNELPFYLLSINSRIRQLFSQGDHHIQRSYRGARYIHQHHDKKMELREKFSTYSFGGYQKIFAHDSKTQNCEMRFAIYLPDQCQTEKLPVIYFLSGLTMDHIEFIEKSGTQRIASNCGVIIVAPDSSPRNTNIPGENEKWNVGTKASYYIDTTAEPWCRHYKMYSYISNELPSIVTENFPALADKQSIMGHSIGGHGAFMIKMLNPLKFKSVSALSPVCDITKAPHSIEGLKMYLGSFENENWKKWSATETAKNYKGPPLHILIDQGSADEYLPGHLFPEDFLKACQASGISVTFNLRERYTHNYYFVASFIEDHIKYHLNCLK